MAREKQCLIRIGRAVGDDAARADVSLVREVVELQIEPREAEPRGRTELDRLVKIRIQQPIGRRPHGIVVVQEIAVPIRGLEPAAPSGGMVVLLLKIQHVPRHVGHLLAVPQNLRDRARPVHSELISEVDVLGIDMGVGPGEAPAGRWPPIVTGLDAPVLRGVGIDRKGACGGRIALGDDLIFHEHPKPDQLDAEPAEIGRAHV